MPFLLSRFLYSRFLWLSAAHQFAASLDGTAKKKKKKDSLNCEATGDSNEMLFFHCNSSNAEMPVSTLPKI